MIKVIIDRTVAEGLEQHYDHCLRETVSLIESAQGFLGSETLRDIENSCHRVTVSLWDNIQCWSQWLHSDNRRELHSRIYPLLDHEEAITILTH
ncbi:antibiotic biosynthesis monooxygenase family protein [Sansalvadorimonas verongulae]|uniref:antibiotic biosynthesis monooxygenase family protein n=1 Tax=Sansalvadorimonas verongulae TaxID=2172824 RepID=UPI0012BB7C72|nr:antibiotic biosynthesis monooxygenase [Sansalvadorimonas verongulae]MTI11938.1 antibiotic biosynthesis monooxygenase [Sansalvadorimonas verongulae]